MYFYFTAKEKTFLMNRALTKQSQDNDFDMCHTAQKQAGIDG